MQIFERKSIEKIYSTLVSLDFVADVLRVFSGGKETQKLQVIKTVWESTRIQILQVCYERLCINFPLDNKLTSTKIEMDRHLQSLLTADDSECKLTHFCFVNAFRSIS